MILCRKWVWLCIAAAILFGLAWRWRPESVSANQLVGQARLALNDGDPAAAEALCRRALDRDPNFVPALLLAGEASVRQKQASAALAYFSQVPSEASREALVARRAASDILFELGRVSDAEQQARAALAIEPHDPAANRRLALLLTVGGRRYESVPYLFDLLRQNRFSIEMLILLGDQSNTVARPEELEKFRRGAPNDPLSLLGLARIALHQNKPIEAQRLLSEVKAARPEWLEAQAEWGQLMLSSGDERELNDWLRQLSAAANSHPDIWRIRGLRARQQGQTKAAARCFWEALKLDPNQQVSTYQLAQLLAELDDSAASERLAQRAIELEELAHTLRILYDRRKDRALIEKAARLTESLGRLWEAWGWCCWGRAVDPQQAWAVDGAKRLQACLNDDMPLTISEHDPTRLIDLSHYPLPAWPKSIVAETSEQIASQTAQIEFVDVAADAGIRFAYFNGAEAVEEGRRMFQFTGGGIAVLDYDGDGGPDLYFTQGGRWPLQDDQAEHLDRLFRNCGDGRFKDVTAAAGLAENRFSQGATVGDVNDDGWPDIYIANIGVNRLYVNQGDGTFRDATASAGIRNDTWTISCLLADLNGDGMADIYDVNYVQGPDVYDKVCVEGKLARVCAPNIFEPQPDQFFLNQGDGRFLDQTANAGLAAAGGNGMGVIAADFEGQGRLNLFVANDQDANFYFVNETPQPGDAPRFSERGVVSGLAFDGDGRAQACMGVAAGDADGDAKLDLFVTNFYGESNSLYRQETSHLFSDASVRFGLHEPSLKMLGFGTQFLDGDLDGRPDLVVANGHIGDFTHRGAPYRMPPQYFRNLGGRFLELPAEMLGPYFQQQHLARGLARLDWNRDGKEDFAVSHLGDPVALLTNRTESFGHYLAIQLRGVKSSRDAIGAIVTLQAGGRIQRQWLSAGDGYAASNQRQLVFGLGGEQKIGNLHVRWPSGLEQEFQDLEPDQEMILVEGAARLTPIPAVR